MSQVSPIAVLARVAQQVPQDCRQHIIVIGSLAAAYHLFGVDQDRQVRTKDIDCILVPRIEAVRAGKAVVETLLAAGWRRRAEGNHAAPGTAATPDDGLPVVRLYPPDSTDWFIELLTVQEGEDERDRSFQRMVLSDGSHYALAGFRFLDLAACEPVATPAGIRCARLEMMVLSNLLRNPVIRPDRMLSSGWGRKRSNKDLGRVLTVARLLEPGTTELWAGTWEEALRELYPDRWKDLAARTGAGIRALLASEEDLREALDISVVGLLSSAPPTLDAFRLTGRRLLGTVVKELEERARQANKAG